MPPPPVDPKLTPRKYATGIGSIHNSHPSEYYYTVTLQHGGAFVFQYELYLLNYTRV